MKFLPSLKSAKALALVAATIATAIASSAAPSLAHQPTRLISTPGKPDLVIYDSTKQSFALGCKALSNLFQLPTQQVTAAEYQQSVDRFEVGNLPCNDPNLVKAATFLSGDGVITIQLTRNLFGGTTTRQSSFFVLAPSQFFGAMGITPTQLNEQQGINLSLGNNIPFDNTRIEAGLQNLAKPTPKPPVTPAPAPPAPLRRLLVLRPDSFASEIIQAPGKPELVIFPNMNQSFTSGCQAVRNLWSKIPTKQVTVKDYEVVQRRNVIGELYCNQPTRVKAYTSPAFSPHAGVIVTNGKPFVVRSGEVFNAMNVDLIRLSEEEGQKFIDRNLQLIDNAVITPNNR
jgi:cyclic lactone autoinducer peptide